MKRFVILAGSAFAAMWLVVRPAIVAAQAAPDLLQNSRIEIEYIEPTQSYLQPIYKRLRERQFLEQLKQFLAPLRLPEKLPIRMMQCGVTNSWYTRGQGLKLCYEWPDWVERSAPADKTSEGFSREDVIVGGFLQVVFHELGHAVFHLLQVPIFGREEDAADQIAAFIMMQFGKEVARRTLTGSAQFWRAADKPWSRTAYSDEHGTELQRFYNILCIAYGGDPDTFRDIVASSLLPKARADHCAREYQQIRNAFVKTILPHVDQDLMKRVQSMEWLKPDDGK